MQLGAVFDGRGAGGPVSVAVTKAIQQAHNNGGDGVALFRVTRSTHKSREVIFAGSPSSAVIVQRAFVNFAQYPCLGEVVSDGSATLRLRWRSFAEMGAAVEVVSRALRHATPEPEHAIVTLCAPNSPGWLVCDFAAVVARLPSACVDHTLGVIDGAIAATDAALAVDRAVAIAIVAADVAVEWAAELALPTQLTPASTTHDHGLFLDGLVFVAGASSPAAGATSVREFASTRAAHAALRAAAELPIDAPLTALFTSGSTGIPKPRWISARSWLSRNPKGATVSRVSAVPVFSPLSHGLGRRQAWREMTHGGRVGLLEAAGRSSLLEQLSIFEPSSVTAVPAFFTLLTQRHELLWQAAVAQRRADAQRPCATALTRSHSMGDVAGAGGGEESCDVSACAPATSAHEGRGSEDELAALRATRQLLGRRLMHVSVGGAHVPRATMVFLERCFGIGGQGGGNAIISNGYGATETGGIARNGELLAQWLPPLGECKLDEALGAALGQPAGVGEILLRSTSSENAIAAPVDDDGWYHTGDLGRWVGDTLDPERGKRRLDVVDRAGFAVKLANGEFVCPQLLEGLFDGAACPSVLECCLVAAPGANSITAVVVPAEDGVGESHVLEEIHAAARAANARPYEVPAAVVLDRGGPWTPKNGCRTASGKLRRAAIAKRAGLDGSDGGGSSCGGGATEEQPFEQRVVRFLMAPSDAQARAVLPEALAGDVTLAQLGGNSIMATRVAELLPGVGVRRVVSTPLDLLRREIQSGAAAASVAPENRGTEFWAGEVEAPAAQMLLQPTETCSAASSAMAAAEAAAVEAASCGAILLTGVTGFLGPHLLQALAADPAMAHLVLICLVRQPVERVRVPDGAASRVRLLASDLSEPALGLSDADAASITNAGVVLIVHNGARVDHICSYTQLKQPNVLAADVLVALATRGGGAPPAMVFVSSLSAVAPSDTAEELECTPPSRVDLLGGYGQTKWVCERRMAAAVAHGRLASLVVGRLGLIGPHSTSGDANLQDWLHLLLRAIAAVRAVPAMSDPAYSVDLLPVDVVCAALARLGVELIRCRPDECATTGARCDVGVYHLDAESFGYEPVTMGTTLVSALEAQCGREVERGVSYSTWRERVRSAGGDVEAALAVLPLPTTADAGTALRMPRGSRPGLRRERGRDLAARNNVGSGAALSSTVLWSRWADGVARSVAASEFEVS